MRFGIIGPCEDEIQPFICKLEDVTTAEHAMVKFHSGTYNGLDVVALFCGVCKVNAAIATQILINKYDVTHIIVTGVAGAIDASLAISDTIISSEIGYHDVADGILTNYHPWMESVYFKADQGLFDDILRANDGDDTVQPGKIVTGEAFIHQEGRDVIIDKHAPHCVDMETAAIAHVCYANDVPFVAIRSISDTPHESGSESFEKYFKQAAEKSIAVSCLYLDYLAKTGIQISHL
ncbi:MAG: 5'-methylthioadenosine/adenosylhomocysteine nucleosidase [Defluviitaleaceae bacterium]|nr:5'-methylthioadenosine/adenosylhomocysteine nucleosidase [Defluviitaleaceae bacterium]